MIDNVQFANAIRFLAVDAVQKANSGHPGMPCGMADVATVLFSKHLKFSAKHPKWPERDRFVLSCGHGSMLLYALLYLTGYEDITIDHIQSFRQLGSPCAGHPEYGTLAGIETTTGPLGQGLANAVGMALSEKRQNALDLTFSHYTYVFASDGDMMEGISHEALSFAGHYGLNKLIIFYDANDITIDGALSLSCSDNATLRFQSYGFYVQTIDGHDYDAIDVAIVSARISEKPSVIICKTMIAKGAPHLEGSASAHGSPLGADEVTAMRIALNWPYASFEIPTDVLNEWRKIGSVHTGCHPDENQDPLSCVSDMDPDFRQDDSNTTHNGMATRNASQLFLEELIPQRPDIMIGSADLTPSNNTHTKTVQEFSKNNPQGQYIHFGIREHAMAGIMNGIALHGFFRPVGGTFLCFSDYMRPSIRLAAIMRLPVIYVFTHDSIGLGEDGPTHQPVEHLSSLSAIPSIHIYRPCDMQETFWCWQSALEDKTHPSLLCLSRQKLPNLSMNQNIQAAYVLADFGDNYVCISSGSEVQIAHGVAQELEGKVISVPCLELWNDHAKLLGTAPRIIIEAGHRMRWDHLLRPQDYFFGVETFGHSAPYEKVYEKFNLNIIKIISVVKQR